MGRWLRAQRRSLPAGYSRAVDRYGCRDVGRVRRTWLPPGVWRSGVPLQRLRPVIDELRREFNTPYSFATARPFVLDRELILQVDKERNDLPFAIAIVRSGQAVMLTEVASRFVRKAVFDATGDRDVGQLHPAGPASSMEIDPLVRSVSGACGDRYRGCTSPRIRPAGACGDRKSPRCPVRREHTRRSGHTHGVRTIVIVTRRFLLGG